MAIGEVWFAPRYMDVSAAGVISKVYSAGKPVSLGTTGLLHDGHAPYIYHSDSSFVDFGTGQALAENAAGGARYATSLPV